jgi:hypothetical protein
MRFISGIPDSTQRLASYGPNKIDDQEYLILREEEILAKLSGIAKAASGMKRFPPVHIFWSGQRFSFTQEGELQWQNKL